MEEVTIRWRGKGEEVRVAGEFSGWEVVDMSKEGDGGTWAVKLNLGPGRYMYKFVVDGEWIVNQDMPTVNDEQGNQNNLIEVEESDSTGGDSDSWEKVSIPETENGTNGSALQKISVVERIFTLNSGLPSVVSLIEEKNGSLVDEKKYTNLYFDTCDYQMLRKGIWLKQRVSEEAKNWEWRSVINQEFKIVDDLGSVTQKLEKEIGSTGSLEDIVDRSLQEIMRVEGKLSRWRLGALEIELKKEGEVSTALVRAVGDLVGALKDLEDNAKSLLFTDFNLDDLTKKLRAATE